MSTPAAQVDRTYVAPGSVWDVARNRDHTTGVGRLIPQDLVATTDRPGVWLQWTMLAGFPVAHGEVADEAAMLALHTFAMDSADNPLPRYVAPGDSCTRTDDPGWRWYCLAGHGLTLADWERRPLAGALEGLAVTGHTQAISTITGLQTALDALSTAAAAKAPINSPGLIGSPTAPTPAADDHSTRIATTEMVHAAITAAGGSSGGGSLPITDGLVSWITGAAANAVVDETGLTSPAWYGAPATVSGPLGFALDFSGSNYVSAVGPAGGRTYRDGFTICTWIRPTAQPAGGVYVGRAELSYYLYYYPYSEWKIAFDPRSISGSTYLTTYSRPVPVDSWAFVAAQWDPIGRCFVWAPNDAWDQLTRTAIDSRSIVTDAAAQPIIVGSGVAGTQPFVGQIGMYATWSRLLSAREIARIWNGGTGRTYADL